MYINTFNTHKASTSTFNRKKVLIGALSKILWILIYTYVKIVELYCIYNINNRHRKISPGSCNAMLEVVQCSQPSLDCVSCCCCAVAGAAMRGCLAQPPHPGSSTASPGSVTIHNNITISTNISGHLSVPPPIAASHCTISAYRHSAAVVEMYNR